MSESITLSTSGAVARSRPSASENSTQSPTCRSLASVPGESRGLRGAADDRHAWWPIAQAGKPTIGAIDCGMKHNIVRYFVETHDVTLIVVPFDYDLEANPRVAGAGFCFLRCSGFAGAASAASPRHALPSPARANSRPRNHGPST